MWKDYSAGFIKNNRASGISIIVSAFISSLFLSLLCSLFFNLWTYEIEQIRLEEGGWQGRITGNIGEEELSVIQNFANVERAVVNEKLSDGEKTVVDLYFRNKRTIFEDVPLILKKLGLEAEAADYHHLLLSRYLIHDPADEEPPLLMAFYLFVLLVVSFSLILIIHNSFAVSMNARIFQFGIFSSIGATPGQIRACLLQEAAALCAVPVLAGSLLGILLCFAMIRVMNGLAFGIAGRHEAVFVCPPLVSGAALLLAALTALFSAWIPAKKLSRLTPLEAIRNTGEFTPKRGKHFPILSAVFGVEGELAGNALRAMKKALRTSAISLTLSFLGFTLMVCFFTLSDISTEKTYFARYQDVWDIMVTVKNTGIEDAGRIFEGQKPEGVKDLAVYQKAEAVSRISEECISPKLTALGGPGALAGEAVSREDGFWMVKAPLVILDDAGFMRYCEQTGTVPGLDGVILLNRIWESKNSNFRYREYIPYVEEAQSTAVLMPQSGEGEEVTVPVLACTGEAPVLREEYEDYTLVHVLPLSLWKEISGKIKGAEKDSYVRILAKDRDSLEGLNALEEDLVLMAGREYEVETENRVREKAANDYLIRGYQIILGGFCCLLALIGIANVFSNTLGFLRQRKREFARYMSVGMTPGSMKKMFVIEALVIAGRPFLVTVVLSAAAVGWMIKASHLEAAEFLTRAPAALVLAFGGAVFGFVALAYYIGGKRVLECSLADALRDDRMM